MGEGVAYEQEASEPHQPHRPGQAVPVPGRSAQLRPPATLPSRGRSPRSSAGRAATLTMWPQPPSSVFGITFVSKSGLTCLSRP